MVEAFELNVPLVSTTSNNYSDFFTKPLNAKRFFYLRDQIMNVANSHTCHANEHLDRDGHAIDEDA